jgi:CubicO group peptidase (beta-lactamase class C family)
LVVVRDDRLVYLKGFGVREAGKPEPVTPDTVFPLASCTKSFTTLAMGILVDEGKMDWDDPVRKHVPYLHLSDPLADATVTLRDLVAHRTGVASHDLLWYGTGWSLEERIRRVGKLELARPFRSSFRYQVVLFSAAGVAVGSASGGSWEEFVQHRILGPLGMKASTCTFPADNSKRELASPHRLRDGKVSVAPRFPLSAPDPAGSLHTTVRDLARYLRFQLGDGTWQGERLISAESLTEPHTPQIVLRLTGGARTLNPDTQFLTYGMGWVVQDYRGKRLVMHGGSIDGFRTHLTLVPEARLGIALLNNLDGGLMNLALSNSLVDHFLDLPVKDWSTYYHEIQEEDTRQSQARAKALRANRSPDGPPRPLAAYAGVYDDAAYGPCTIAVADGRLVWNWAKLHGILEHFQKDSFFTNQDFMDDMPFEFGAGADGRIETLQALGGSFRKQK